MADGPYGTEDPGAWLRHQRRAAGLTQEELAALSGLGVRTIGDLERGVRSPYPRSLRLVTSALGISEIAADELVASYRMAENGVTMLPRQAGHGHLAELPSASMDTNPGRPGPIPAVTPRQLPAGNDYFVGREAELAILDRLAEQAPSVSGAVPISVICGMAGVGKTALALRWAHRIASQFPDGQLYVNLRGYGPGRRHADPVQVVRSLLGALGVAPEWIPLDPESQAGLYRSVLAGKRVLIVADNARDAAQVRMLLPGTSGCLVLVTSRSPLISLATAEGAHVLNLGVPTVAEAAQLLSARLGGKRVAAEPAAVSALIDACGRLPLALAVLAARAVESGWRLSSLAAEMTDTRGRLNLLDHGDPAVSVGAAFSWSYRQLDRTSARVFRLLSVHPGPEISVPAVASLTGLPLGPALAALRDLADVSLIAEPVPGRYALHDLLRAYAAAQAKLHHSGEDLQAAASRLLDYYLHTAAAASRALDPDEEPATLEPARRGVLPEAIADADQALAWFTAEHKVLLAMTAHAAEPAFAQYAMRLPWTMAGFLERNGQFHELAESQHVALACAERLGDLAGQARTQRYLGVAYTRLGQGALARTHLTRVVELSQQLADQAAEVSPVPGTERGSISRIMSAE